MYKLVLRPSFVSTNVGFLGWGNGEEMIDLMIAMFMTGKVSLEVMKEFSEVDEYYEFWYHYKGSRTLPLNYQINNVPVYGAHFLPDTKDYYQLEKLEYKRGRSILDYNLPSFRTYLKKDDIFIATAPRAFPSSFDTIEQNAEILEFLPFQRLTSSGGIPSYYPLGIWICRSKMNESIYTDNLNRIPFFDTSSLKVIPKRFVKRFKLK